MSTVIVRPDETWTATAGTKVGGATTHGVVGDNSDASWIEMWPELGYARVVVAAPTKPAGSVTKYVQLVGRASSISVNSTKVEALLEIYGGNGGSNIAAVQFSGTTPTTLYGPVYQPGDLSAAQIGDYVIAFRRSATGAVTNARWYDLWVVVTFAEMPVASATGPTGSGTSGTVTGTWAHTPGVDGGPQAWYLSRIFTAAQYSIGGFDPWNSPGVTTSGVVASAATSHVHSGLAPGTYRHYVTTAQQIYAGQGQWANWSYTDFTVAVPPATTTAEVSTVTAAAMNSSGFIRVTVNRDAAKDPWTAGTMWIELERLEPGGSYTPVRGVTAMTPGASSLVVDDWEASPHVAVNYRARAVKVQGPTVGAWKTTASGTTWTVTSGFWMKCPDGMLTLFNYLAAAPSMEQDENAAYHRALGARKPIAISDARSARTGTLEVITETEALASALAVCADEAAVLIHAPTWWRFAPGWFRLGNLPERHVTLKADEWRIWPIPVTEVVAPAVVA